MASESRSLEYRADSPDAYADALLRLVNYARASQADFTFGPLRLADCERDGLTISGSDLSLPVHILAAVSGLVLIHPAEVTFV